MGWVIGSIPCPVMFEDFFACYIKNLKHDSSVVSRFTSGASGHWFNLGDKREKKICLMFIHIS